MQRMEEFDVVILGGGQDGKLLAWRLGKSGKRIAVVERRCVGGSCPAVACLPSKNEIWSAMVAHVVRKAVLFGTRVEGVTTEIRTIRDRKQDMVERIIAAHFWQITTKAAWNL